jgi:hypothetical protein
MGAKEKSRAERDCWGLWGYFISGCAKQDESTREPSVVTKGR